MLRSWWAVSHLVGGRGFYQYLKRCHIIYLDSELDEATARFVCGHELGHSLMHRGLNRIFMGARTLFVTGRYETEANQFSVVLVWCAGAYMCVSNELAAYRMQEVVPEYPADEWT